MENSYICLTAMLDFARKLKAQYPARFDLSALYPEHNIPP